MAPLISTTRFTHTRTIEFELKTFVQVHTYIEHERILRLTNLSSVDLQLNSLQI